MSFFKNLVDEMNDRNIDTSKLPKKAAISEKIDMDDPTKLTEKSMKDTENFDTPEPEQPEQPQEEIDPDFPDHPDYIALKPHLTERELWRMPAIRFYSTIICFCLGMILYGIINGVLDLGMTKGAVGWYQIFGAAIGFMLSREVLEPRLRIPFAKGTYEQKKAATDAYLARIAALDQQIETLHKMQDASNTDTKNNL